MKRRLFHIIVVVLVAGAVSVAVTGCGEMALRASPTPVALTEEELRGALLTVEDLPAGWRRDEAADEGEEGAEASVTFLGRELPDRSRFTVRARFSGGDLGPFLSYYVTAFPAGQAAVTFAEQAEVIQAAHPYTLTLSGGETMAMEMWPLTLATVGSDSVAVRSVSEEAPLFGTVYTDSVYVLVAEAEAIIRVTGIALGGEAMNREQMKTLAQRGVEKLSGVLEER